MICNPYSLHLTPATTRKDMPPLLYLACPYSHPDRLTRAHRALVASEAAARLMAAGYAVFSPISHGHAVCEADQTGTVGTDAESWTEINDVVLTACDALVAMDIPGIWESVGVRLEVAMAQACGLPVNLIRFKRNALEVEAGVDPMLFSDAGGRL